LFDKGRLKEFSRGGRELEWLSEPPVFLQRDAAFDRSIPTNGRHEQRSQAVAPVGATCETTGLPGFL